METHLAQLKQMHQDLAGADVAGAEVMAGPGGDEQVTLVLATKGGKQYRMAFDMQVITSPPRLLTLNVIEE
jgi:hypothetical protein